MNKSKEGKITIELTEDYKKNYDLIDWSIGAKQESKVVEEKNPNDRTDRWGFHLRRWFVK